MTHYLPFFARPCGRLLRAVCGTYVSRADHSIAPECQACQAWIESKHEPESKEASV